MRGWHRRFFVLQDKFLYSFSREDDVKVSSTYLLLHYQLSELPVSAEDPDKFPFELTPEKASGESVTLCASSDAERKEWMKGLLYNMYADQGGAIFGLPLAEAMKYEHKYNRTVPYIVEACVEYLKAFAMDAEGIFRLAGRAGLLKELRAQFEAGKHPSLNSIDVHTVGALLKAYLRELPESLVPPILYQRTMNCAMRYAEAKAEDKQADEVALMAKLLGEEIPADNYNTLAYLCDFLHRLAANSDKTKMDARNLALVFGPNLIRHMDNSPELLMLTADLTQHLAYMLIHHYREVLPLRPTSALSTARRPKGFSIAATGDLLRLSQPVEVNDPCLLMPQSLSDLQGLEFTQTDNVFTPDSHESPVSPVSPFEFHSDHFHDTTNRSLLDSMEGSTSSESSSRGNTLERGVTGLEEDSKPVPPKRRQKTVKQRRSNGTPVSPSIDPSDVQKALVSVCHPMMLPRQDTGDTKFKDGSESPVSLRQQKNKNRHTQVRSPDDEGFKSFLLVSDRGSVNGEVDSKGHVHKSLRTGVSQTEKAQDRGEEENPVSQAGAGGGHHTSKLAPSHSDLQAQVALLKSELVKSKKRSEQLMNQLTDIKQKYEARITTMEKQHLSQVIDLTGKLDMERNTRAEAVERTVALQKELYKYKMQYGDLKE